MSPSLAPHQAISDSLPRTRLTYVLTVTHPEPRFFFCHSCFGTRHTSITRGSSPRYPSVTHPVSCSIRFLNLERRTSCSFPQTMLPVIIYLTSKPGLSDWIRNRQRVLTCRRLKPLARAQPPTSPVSWRTTHENTEAPTHTSL